MPVKRVLICGPDFHGLIHNIADGFMENKWDVTIALSRKPRLIIRALMRRALELRAGIIKGGNTSAATEVTTYHDPTRQDPWAFARYRQDVLVRWEKDRYDLLLIIRPDFLTSEFFLALKNSKPSVPVAIWSCDPIRRFRVEEELLRKSDRVFVYDSGDVPYVQALGGNAAFLPMAFNSKLYPNRFTLTPLKYILNLVGTISLQREKDLLALIRGLDLKRQAVLLFGGPIFWVHKYARLITGRSNPLDHYIASDYAQPIQLNDIYRASVLSLNIHQPGAERGFNPRFFEIPAAGGFQFARHVAGMEEFFVPEREIITYETEEELLDKARYYIKNRRARDSICHAAFQRAHNDHTFQDRISKILSDLGL